MNKSLTEDEFIGRCICSILIALVIPLVLCSGGIGWILYAIGK